MIVPTTDPNNPVIELEVGGIYYVDYDKVKYRFQITKIQSNTIVSNVGNFMGEDWIIKDFTPLLSFFAVIEKLN